MLKRRGRLQELSASRAAASEARAAPESPTVPEADQHSETGSLEQEWLHRIHEKLIELLDLSQLVELPERNARIQIREITQRLINEYSVPLSASSRARIVKGVEDEVLGLGPLEPLFADNTVADILVNGAQSVYVERFGKLEKTAITFKDDAHLLNIIDRIVSNVGRRIDESSPMVDARLKDGSRVNAIIPPLAIDGPSMSIRRFSVEKLGMDELVHVNSVSPQMASMLNSIVSGRLNVLVSGGTGSGKTTMLNVLSGFISHKERVVTIEDSAELQLQQPHVIRLETRPGNIEGQGEVTQRDLVRNSLRMRPDRIIVGEVRGGEALDMLQAMNTGHDGSLATIHANSPRDAFGRLENMVSMAGLTLPMHAIRAQIAAAIDVIIQLERLEDGTRKLISIQEVQGMEGDIITLSEIFHYKRTGIDVDGKVIGNFRATGLIPEFLRRIKERGQAIDLSIFNVQ
jgi:pilus assembly protein CpaF